MIERLQSIIWGAPFAPERWLEPNLADPQIARQQRLLNLVLFGLAIPGALFGLVMLLLWIAGATPPAGALAGLGVQPFYALAYWLGRKGKVTQAAYIPIGAVFIAMLGGGLLLGIGHVTYLGFAMVTLTASILIGTRAGLGAAALATLANLVIGLLQANGKLPAAIDPRTTVVADSIGMGLGLVVLITFTGIYGSELKKALFAQQALSAELQVNQANLENQVRRRTRDLERRLVQIRTAAEISRTISAVLDPGRLLQQVVELVQERFALYYVGVFLINTEGEYAVLAAGTGEAGRMMLLENHKLAVGGPSMIGWTTFNRQPRIALDVGQEAVRFNNPHLPLTRSELALPILRARPEASAGLGQEGGQHGGPDFTRERVPHHCLGAITVQSTQPGAFDQDDITVLQAIADSLATALENARLYQQAQSNLEEIRGLHRQYLSRRWAEVKRPPAELSYVYEVNRPVPQNTSPSVIQVPLSLRDQVIGNLSIERDEPDLDSGPASAASLSAEDLAFIEAVAVETAEALENARLLDETQGRAQREQFLAELSGKVRASSNVEVVLRTSILELGRALRASEGTIQIDVDE